MVVWESVRFVMGVDGRPTAVQVSIDVWQQIVTALEEAEDIALARQALAELKAAGGDPARAGWLRLEDAEKEWERDGAL